MLFMIKNFETYSSQHENQFNLDNKILITLKFINFIKHVVSEVNIKGVYVFFFVIHEKYVFMIFNKDIHEIK